MQMPLEELTNNTIERNLVPNWFLKSTSSVASRTIGYREKLLSLREEEVNFEDFELKVKNDNVLKKYLLKNQEDKKLK